MTPQMLHATLSTGQITIWEDRLDVTPKTPQQVLGWLQREEGLRACGFDELDREMQYRLLSHQDRCREMELPQPDYGAYRFFVLPRGPRMSSSMKNMSGTPITGRSPCMFGSRRTAGWTATPPFCGYGSNCWRVSAERGWPSAGRRRCL